MRLYELLKQISDILTPSTHSFYDYMLHTFDDNGGFLRTRFCYREKCLADREVEDLEQVLICFREPFEEGDEYYRKSRFGNGEGGETPDTLVKMQLFYYDCGDMQREIEWSRLFPYPEACIVNLKEGTYTTEYHEPLL